MFLLYQVNTIKECIKYKIHNVFDEIKVLTSGNVSYLMQKLHMSFLNFWSSSKVIFTFFKNGKHWCAGSFAILHSWDSGGWSSVPKTDWHLIEDSRPKLGTAPSEIHARPVLPPSVLCSCGSETWERAWTLSKGSIDRQGQVKLWQGGLGDNTLKPRLLAEKGREGQ